MKTLTCMDLGAPTCTHEYHVASYEELMTQMKEHVAADPIHEPERTAMAAATPEQMAEWDAKWRATFDAKAEDAAPAAEAPAAAAPAVTATEAVPPTTPPAAV